MFKIQNKICFENLNFEFGICLGFRILNLGFPKVCLQTLGWGFTYSRLP